MFLLVATVSAQVVKSECFSEPPARRIKGAEKDFMPAIPVSGVVAKESFMNFMLFFSATSSRRWGRPLKALIVFMIRSLGTPMRVAARAAGRTFSMLWGPRRAIFEAFMRGFLKNPVLRKRVSSSRKAPFVGCFVEILYFSAGPSLKKGWLPS